MKTTRNPKKLPAIRPPDSAEREYLRFLHKYANRYIELMRTGLEEILPGLKEVSEDEQPEVRQDSVRMDENIEARLRKLFDRVGKQMNEAFTDATLRAQAKAMVGRVNRDGKKKVAKSVQAGFRNKDQAPDFSSMFHDKKLSPYFDNIVDENVGLIRSIPNAKLDLFKNQLVSLLTRNATMRDIRKAIAANFKISKDRAALIARDQVGKLNGELNKYRQQQLGGERYIWRTSRDQRVRHPRPGKLGGDHKRLEGKTFTWNKPPIVDTRTGRRAHPGEDYQCRCYAEMVLEDILE